MKETLAMTVRTAGVLSGNLSELFYQRWKVLGHGVPDDIEIHVEVSMDEAVTQADHELPGDIRMISPEFGRNPSCGLADDLEEPYEREVEHPIGCEVFAGAVATEIDRFLRGIEKVLEPYVIIPVHTRPAFL